MKTNSEKPLRFPLKRDEYLFTRTLVLLSADLNNPQIEDTARRVLSTLRKKRYAFESFDLEDPECLSCLYLALESAADLALATGYTH
jgi:hypothetical protein